MNAQRDAIGRQFAWCGLFVFVMGFGGWSSIFIGADHAGEPPQYLRLIGVPFSPWLVGECRVFNPAERISCLAWEYSIRWASWSWLLVPAGVASLGWLRRRKEPRAAAQA